ncbi:MAG: hypothetical protein QOF62_2457 [Pyrinomonadaceae bacterium]|jgi:hypothetical protein|nr:hypothetical protein [Pyrinomonadaceae bacterium]
MRYSFLILSLLLVAGTARAQQPEDKAPVNDAVQAVIDDDGGRAFIVNSKLKSLAQLRRLPGAAALTAPQQYTIFLGSRWATASLRARESKLSNLLAAIQNQPDVNKLNNLGINNLFGPTYTQEVLTQFNDDEKLSDIGIKTILAGLVADGTLPKADRTTVYVVYLQPDVRSTLGTLTGRKHYLAYHEFLNVGGERLHYVVVPYEPDIDTAKAIALRALVAAALNPNGDAGN